MCGICGVLNYGLKEKVPEEVMAKMNDCLGHRGPDDSGYYFDKYVGLGHRRLSIIDLEGGHQPIFNEDKNIVTTCNGEIYNFKSLREELISKGHKFYTKSDTEVIVHLYEEYGRDLVNKLRGMFALAVWDSNKEELTLARDRLGIKPLFYAVQDDKLLFSSEIKSILNSGLYEKNIDYQALHNYLSFMTTSGRRTIFEGVSRLLPGQMLIYSKGQIKKDIYWRPPVSSKKKVSWGDFYDILLDSVKSHLVSDVELGAFLSGGLDSSAVVGLMSKIMDRPVKTFSIGFSGDEYYNELPFARAVAAHFKTDHQEFVVTPDLVKVLPKIIEYFDEPFAVSSALPLYFLSQLAREKVKVVLSGDGADESMAGYHHRYLALKLARHFDRNPFLKKLPLKDGLKIVMGSKRNKVDKFFSQIDSNPEDRYFRYMTKFQEEQKKSLYSDSLRQETTSFNSGNVFSHYYEEANVDDFLNRYLYLDLKTSLPDEMLTKVDRMTMAHGLEARVPFLDHLLIEYVLPLSSKLKLKGKTPKYILRKAMKGILPRSILKRKKHGFEVPVDEWIRGKLKEYIKEYLNEDRIKREGFFNWDTVKGFLDDHCQHKANYGHQLWILLMFGIWHEKYLS